MDAQANPDATLAVEFFLDAIENGAKSREANRPIFDDVEMVRIRFPGDGKRELVAPAHEMHYVSHAREQMTYAERFRGSYEAFKDGVADFMSGTPLSAVAFLTPSQRSEMKALNILTVEQLAGLPDRDIRRVGMHARDLVEKAKDYLSSSKDSTEIAELRRQLAELQAGQQSQAEPAADPFEGLEDDDLRNMIRDAGHDAPRGGRAKLVAKLDEIAKAKEAA